MTQKSYNILVAIIFTIVALVHAARIAKGWNLIIADASIPMYVSWIGLVVTALLAVYGFIFGFRKL